MNKVSCGLIFSFWGGRGRCLGVGWLGPTVTVFNHLWNCWTIFRSFTSPEAHAFFNYLSEAGTSIYKSDIVIEPVTVVAPTTVLW